MQPWSTAASSFLHDAALASRTTRSCLPPIFPGPIQPALIVVSSIAITGLGRTEAHCAAMIGFTMSMERLGRIVSDDRLIVMPAASRCPC